VCCDGLPKAGGPVRGDAVVGGRAAANHNRRLGHHSRWGATITSYDFTSGDGNTTGQAKHTYKSPATYTVTLTVINSAGQTGKS
jgi:hypothetical protein